MMISRTAAVRRAGGEQHPGDPVPARGRPGGRRRRKDLESGHEFEIRAGQGDQRGRSLDRPTCSKWSAAGGSSRCGPRRACTSWCRATGSTAPPSHSPDRKKPAVHHPARQQLGDRTTDTDWALDKAHPAASSSDIDYLLEHANALLADPLTREDVVGVYAGLRPLLAGESESTSRLSREHAVSSPVAGLTVIAGGKYTTYRVMAKTRSTTRYTAGADRTGVHHRAGAAGRRRRVLGMWNNRALTAARSGLRVHVIEHLLNRYGSLSPASRLIEARPELGRPLPSAPDYLQAEIVYAACTRVPCTWKTSSPGGPGSRSRARSGRGRRRRGRRTGGADPRLASGAVANEVDHYRLRVKAERESQEQPDDQTADAARLGAPDVRTGASG